MELHKVVALLGVPARAAMAWALVGGDALPASELAYRAGVPPQTASHHLARMVDCLRWNAVYATATIVWPVRRWPKSWRVCWHYPARRSSRIAQTAPQWIHCAKHGVVTIIWLGVLRSPWQIPYGATGG